MINLKKKIVLWLFLYLDTEISQKLISFEIKNIITFTIKYFRTLMSVLIFTPNFRRKKHYPLVKAVYKCHSCN